MKIQTPKAVRGEEAAVLLQARRVTRWLAASRPRLRRPDQRLLLIGAGDTSAPALPASVQCVRFDPEGICVELVRAMRFPSEMQPGPEVLDALIERLCVEIFLADTVVIQPGVPAPVALATVGAADALRGRFTAVDGDIDAALTASLSAWSPPSDAHWAPLVIVEAGLHGRLAAALSAALSAPVALL